MLKSLSGLFNDHLFDDDLPSDYSTSRLQHPGRAALLILGGFSIAAATLSVIQRYRESHRQNEATAYAAPAPQQIDTAPYLIRSTR